MKSSTRVPQNIDSLELFFDGDCPLCVREVGLLKRLDRRARILFTDIAAVGFRAPEDVDYPTLMNRIHARRGHVWYEGVEVFRQLYTEVGLGPVVALTRLPGIAQLLDAGYRVFAKNRLRLTGRCAPDGTCALPEVSR